MKRLPFAAAVLATLLPTAAQAGAADRDVIARGAYLGRIMDCAGCHMPRGPNGALIEEAGLSGGTVGFEIPGLGIFWPSNLTPAATGLGDWTGQEIADAITKGVRPDGRGLAPVMPSANYAGLTEGDLSALVAWLQSLPPIENAVPEPAAAGGDAAGPFYRVTLPAR